MYVTEAIDQFLRVQAAEGLAQSTFNDQRYRMDKLRRAARKWETDHRKRSPMRMAEMDADLIANYYELCTGSPGNRNNMTATLRAFLRHAERELLVTPGTAERLMARRKYLHAERKPKFYIDAKDFPMLMDCQTRHPTDRMTMALLLYTLARKSELYALTIKDVDLATHTLKVYRVKTGRYTEVGICPELYYELSIYLTWYEMEAGELQPEWHLLPALIPHRVEKPGGGFDKGTTYTLNPLAHPTKMEKIIKHALDALGVTATQKGVRVSHLGEGAHTIRRSGARAMLKHLSPIMGSADALVTVSVMLDHKDTKMTLRYIGLDQQKEELNHWLRGNNLYGGLRNETLPDRQGHHLRS